MRHDIEVSDQAAAWFEARANACSMSAYAFADEQIQVWLARSNAMPAAATTPTVATAPTPTAPPKQRTNMSNKGSEESRKFGRALRAACHSARMSVADLANRVDVTKSSIYNLQSGNNTPSQALYDRLVAALPELAAVKFRHLGATRHKAKNDDAAALGVASKVIAAAMPKPTPKYQIPQTEDQKMRAVVDKALERLEQRLNDETSPAYLATLGEATKLLHACNYDELSVAVDLLRRINVGRGVYGPLDLASDQRDWDREAHEESLDRLTYRAMARRAAALREARG